MDGCIRTPKADGPAIAAAPALGAVVPAPPPPDELTRRSPSEAEGSSDDEGPMALPDDVGN